MSSQGELTGDRESAAAKRLIRWGGTLLAVLSILFLVVQFRAHAGQIPASEWRAAFPDVALGAILYAVSGIALGVVWWLSVRCATRAPICLPYAMSVQWSSQLAKYLPGNVAHFAARHVMMRRAGLGHASLVAAGLLEAMVLVAAAAALGTGVLRPTVVAMFGVDLPVGVELAAVVVLAAAVAFGWHFARARGWIDPGKRASKALFEWIAAALLAVLFFGGMTICFILVVEGLGLSSFAAVAPWVAASWLLGFVVPGAPGGIGIRELVLVLGLTPLIGEPDALLAAVLFRMTTVGGDAVMAAFGAAGLRWSARDAG